MRDRRFGRAVLATAVALQLAACGEPARRAAQTVFEPPPPPPPPPSFTARDAAQALDTLAHAPDHGFAAARFRTEEIAQDIDASDPGARLEGQRRLRAAILDYARAQHGLTIPTGALPRAWNQRPSRYDADAELDAALKTGTLAAWLHGLPPDTAAYRALQAAYVAGERHGGRARPLVEAAPLEIGEQDRRTRALRDRLALEGDQPADRDAPVDQTLIDALQGFQARHHLQATGVLDAPTLDRLNTPVVNRAARLRVNMERLRWLPRPEPTERVEVNIASATLAYLRGAEPATHMLAVSGKPGDETPLVSSAIDSIVLNPPWYVPNDIARREILPKGQAYMQARHFVWRDGRLIQRPGPKTALGLVKFDFPNPYSVYLHDTPSKASFSLAQRTASHGCIRLQHAVELARIVAAGEPGLSAARIDRILSSGRTVRLKLARPIPVRLVYLTADPQGGSIVYRPDVYGWDAPLLALLDRYSARHVRSTAAAAAARPAALRSSIPDAPRVPVRPGGRV